ANEDKKGLFQVAQNGTLFLDEVADLPMHMQVKLLRSLQEKRIRPIGAAQEMDVNVRVLCATHKDLLKEVGAGTFRQDLYYRLNVIQIHVPPLRTRKEDLPLLCEHFIHRITQAWSLQNITLSDKAKQALQDYDFPGNVRELENIIERAITLCDDTIIERQHLQLRNDATIVAQPSSHTPPAQEPLPPPLLEGETLEEHLLNIEKSILLQALEETHWNRTAAAKMLGLSFRSLRYRLKKLGIDDDNEHVNP
ncbi:MAG: sigma 54-interacting transcriptional regulator, partial [Gammaproteobacteria bacterium]